jgi:hypothetical protein
MLDDLLGPEKTPASQDELDAAEGILDRLRRFGTC